MHTLKHSTFKSFQQSISRKNCNQITNVIAQLYKDKLQLAKIGNVYERIYSRILWFLNTSGYR